MIGEERMDNIIRVREVNKKDHITQRYIESIGSIIYPEILEQLKKKVVTLEEWGKIVGRDCWAIGNITSFSSISEWRKSLDFPLFMDTIRESFRVYERNESLSGNLDMNIASLIMILILKRLNYLGFISKWNKTVVNALYFELTGTYGIYIKWKKFLEYIDFLDMTGLLKKQTLLKDGIYKYEVAVDFDKLTEKYIPWGVFEKKKKKTTKKKTTEEDIEVQTEEKEQLTEEERKSRDDRFSFYMMLAEQQKERENKESA